MYTDHVAPKEVRGQAQSLLVFVTQGVGMWIGYAIVFGKPWLGLEGTATKLTSTGKLGEAITAARGEQTLGFFEGLGKMFTVKLPEGIDPKLLSEAMTQWKAFWTFPAIMALVIAGIFFAAFWDRSRVAEEGE
jgi:hypothetical protein